MSGDAEPTGGTVKLTKAQKRDLLRAAEAEDGIAYGLCYGPLTALVKARLGHEHLVNPYAGHPNGFGFKIGRHGREVAAQLRRSDAS